MCVKICCQCAMSCLPAEEVTPAGFQEVADSTKSDSGSESAGMGSPTTAVREHCILWIITSIFTSSPQSENEATREPLHLSTLPRGHDSHQSITLSFLYCLTTSWDMSSGSCHVLWRWFADEYRNEQTVRALEEGRGMEK